MSKERIYFIYKYTFPNGKVYIGQTYKGSGRYGNCNKYLGTLVGNAMKKYSSFEKEILEYCTKNNVDDRERYYIRKYNSIDRKCGYNRDYGGNLNKVFSSDLKKQLSDAHIDLQVSKIRQYTKEGNFIKEASSFLNIERSSISKVLHNQIRTAGGYKWTLVDKYSPLSEKPISQYDLDGNFICDWENTRLAEESTNIKSIHRCLNENMKTAGGINGNTRIHLKR